MPDHAISCNPKASCALQIPSLTRVFISREQYCVNQKSKSNIFLTMIRTLVKSLTMVHSTVFAAAQIFLVSRLDIM